MGYIAEEFVMAGTLGCFVRKASSSAPYILSNNHVLAEKNQYPREGPILQPGALDGGSPTADRVAKLSAFVALNTHAKNLVDCAIAKVNSSVKIDASTLKGIGQLAGMADSEPGIGDGVHKVG